ncbi:MAG TPA: hypothetical protein VHE09_10785 [Rhizomicrobium sp.]|nr:hypothetical protein [Rhizomicrobium sp.]
MNDRAWDEMLAEFRALGGTAQNIRLGEGALGRGLFPVDPALPIRIHIPESLLLDISDVRFNGGVFGIAADSVFGTREKAFLESYENTFSWGGGGRREMERVFEQGQALPKDIRQVLKAEFHCGDWFDDVTDKFVEQRFIATRCIHYGGRRVVMPIIELANHGYGPTYATHQGVSIQGTFPGEVLVRYATFDPHGTFATWGFACEESQAFSIALGGKIGKSVVHVHRELGALSPANTYWSPILAKESGIAKLPFLMLGNRQHPRLCRTVFYQIMRDAGYSGVEEAFDTIAHANRMHFAKLLATIEDLDGSMTKTLRRVARFQLQALSYCYGVQP